MTLKTEIASMMSAWVNGVDLHEVPIMDFDQIAENTLNIIDKKATEMSLTRKILARQGSGISPQAALMIVRNVLNS